MIQRQDFSLDTNLLQFFQPLGYIRESQFQISRNENRNDWTSHIKKLLPDFLIASFGKIITFKFVQGNVQILLIILQLNC